MDTAQRSLWGRVGAAVARSRHDPRELTANARRTFLAKFEEQVRAEQSGLSPAEVTRRAGELRRAHFYRLAARSAEARSKRKADAVSAAPAQEEDGDAAASTPLG